MEYVWHVLGRIKMLGPLPELAKGEQKRDIVSAWEAEKHYNSNKTMLTKVILRASILSFMGIS